MREAGGASRQLAPQAFPGGGLDLHPRAGPTRSMHCWLLPSHPSRSPTPTPPPTSSACIASSYSLGLEMAQERLYIRYVRCTENETMHQIQDPNTMATRSTRSQGSRRTSKVWSFFKLVPASAAKAVCPTGLPHRAHRRKFKRYVAPELIGTDALRSGKSLLLLPTRTCPSTTSNPWIAATTTFDFRQVLGMHAWHARQC
jgi:hypothetical protein